MPTPAHRPRSPTPFPAGVSSDAAATPCPRRTLRSSSSSAIAAKAGRCRSAALPSTLVRTSFCSSDVSSETGLGTGEASTVRASWENPKLIGPGSSYRGRSPCSELRSSLPETDVSGRASHVFCFRSNLPPSLPRREASNPFCVQSLNSALSDCQEALHRGSLVMLPQSLGPTVPMVRKTRPVMGGKKAAGVQEDVHQLRIMANCYMQYRFLNARAEAVGMARNVAAEESLYGLSDTIASLQESVAEKKAELECLKRVERVHSVAGAQVPQLEQWTELETQHSICLARGTKALYDASSCLPITGNVRTNIGEVNGALDSMKILEQLSPCAEKLSRNVEKAEEVASYLAKVIGSEKVLIEECADLLHQAHDMQAMEASLRIHLMQLKRTKNKT